MGGVKDFENRTDLTLSVTIHVRAGANPDTEAGEQTFGLRPWQSSMVSYGNSRDIYLNGLEVMTLTDGKVTAQQQFVARRGSPFDDILNKNNHVIIQRQGDAFTITSHNSVLITYAGYGVWNRTVDVTGRVTAAYQKGQTVFLASNDWGGDPAPGERKYLFIVWREGNGATGAGVVGENDSTGVRLSPF